MRKKIDLSSIKRPYIIYAVMVITLIAVSLLVGKTFAWYTQEEDGANNEIGLGQFSVDISVGGSASANYSLGVMTPTLVYDDKQFDLVSATIPVKVTNNGDVKIRPNVEISGKSSMLHYMLIDKPALAGSVAISPLAEIKSMFGGNIATATCESIDAKNTATQKTISLVTLQKGESKEFCVVVWLCYKCAGYTLGIDTPVGTPPSLIGNNLALTLKISALQADGKAVK